MLAVFNNDQELYNYYVELYPSRFTENCYASFLYYLVNELKKENPNIMFNQRELDLARENALQCNTKAIQYLFNNVDEIYKLYPNHIQQTAYLINEVSGFAFGYRKTEVAINRDVKFQPVVPRSIPQNVLSLIDNYHNTWIARDPFEREAMLHINLVRVQPFEDGNKRTAQLITSFNLLRNGFAPILIREEERDMYIDYINKNDVEGFANYIRNSSVEELKYIENLKVELASSKHKSASKTSI